MNISDFIKKHKLSKIRIKSAIYKPSSKKNGLNTSFTSVMGDVCKIVDSKDNMLTIESGPIKINEDKGLEFRVTIDTEHNSSKGNEETVTRKMNLRVLKVEVENNEYTFELKNSIVTFTKIAS